MDDINKDVIERKQQLVARNVPWFIFSVWRSLEISTMLLIFFEVKQYRGNMQASYIEHL